jgi:hypothetical protein
MLIEAPTEIEHVLYQGPLEMGETKNQRSISQTVDAPDDDDQPVLATIGDPQWWNVQELFPQGKIPKEITRQLDEADFFLVQLACSLHLNPDQTVEWARFSAAMSSLSPTAQEPIAIDLHPMELYDEISTEIKWSLSPKLKFEKVEGSIGEISSEIKYSRLVPVVTAAGALESRFSWDMEETDKYPLRGARWFHAVIKRPKGAEGVQANFSVTAKVRTKGGLFRAATREEAKERAQKVICR